MKIAPGFLAVAALVLLPLQGTEVRAASVMGLQVAVNLAAVGSITQIQPLSFGDIVPTISGSVSVDPVAGAVTTGGTGQPPQVLATNPPTEAILDVVGTAKKTFSLAGNVLVSNPGTLGVSPVTLTGVNTGSTMTVDTFNVRVMSQAGALLTENSGSFTFPGPANTTSHALIHIGGTLRLRASQIQPADTYNGVLNLTIQFQ